MAYPKPKEHGGTLMRQVIKTLRKEAGLSVPLQKPVVVGVSGGCDSLALALLLAKYGRRVVDRQHLTILHVDHRWRGASSRRDAIWVKKWAHSQGVKFESRRIDARPGRGESWEDAGRQARMKVFSKFRGHFLLTAHHKDDQAETVLWRLLTGTAKTHGGGIRLRENQLLRPLLGVRKRVLQEFLREEEQKWREDITNSDLKFLRSQMRRKILPVIERYFPRAVENLAELAKSAQKGSNSRSADARHALLAVVADQGQRLKRQHFEAVKKLGKKGREQGMISLPGGWKISRDAERWSLTRKL